MKNDVKETNLEIIREGLSYKEELELVAKRFNMTQKEVLKVIIHEIYINGINSYGLEKAFSLLYNYEEFNSFDYNGDGTTTVEDESEIFDKEPPF